MSAFDPKRTLHVIRTFTRLLVSGRERGVFARIRIENFLAIALCGGIGLHEIFHAIIGGLNFSANVEFVGTVLSMDSTSAPDSWRAVNSPAAAYAVYTLIWAAHAFSGILVLAGCVLMASSVRNAAAQFDRGVNFAFVGVGITAVLYLVGFGAFASAWFQLWSAPKPPNYVAEAEGLFLSAMAVLIYLMILKRRQ